MSPPPACTRTARLGHVLRAVWREMASDHVTMVAAGLAYYGIFGLLPAVAAAAALWGLFGDPRLLQSLLQGSDVMPAETVRLLHQFLTSVPQGFGGGVAFAFSLLLVLWTAFRAAGGLLMALNIVYDLTETRSAAGRAVMSLAMGGIGIALLFASLALLALAPLAASWLQGAVALPLLWLRWPVMLLLFAAALALLFRFAPNRSDVHLPSLLCGTVAGTVLSLAASAGISLYVAHAGNFGRLYGSLGGVAVVLLWFYAVALALLVGAEVDATLFELAHAGRATPSSDPPEQDHRA